MKKFWFLGILLLALGFGIYRFQSRLESTTTPIAAAAANAPAKDTCAGKKLCAVAYLAPWCPHCKRVVPELRQKLERAASSSEHGLRVIVGGGEPAENQALATSFGAAGLVDENNQIAQQLGVRGYPAFYLIDEKGAVVGSEEDAYRYVFEKI